MKQPRSNRCTYRGKVSIEAVFVTPRLTIDELRKYLELVMINGVDRIPCDIKGATVQVDVAQERHT